MPMQIDVAELSGLAVEGTLYGVFVCLFVVCTYDLFSRRSRGKASLSVPMCVTGILLILLATARFSVDVANVFVAFISRDPRQSRIAYLEDVTQPLFTTKHSILICVLLVGDSFVNYRCWIVWGKNIYIVLLPVILSITSAASGSYTMWAYSHLPNQTVLSEATWLKSFFSLSLVANGVATSLLAFRIWWVNRRTEEAGSNIIANGHRLTPIIRIILESGIVNAVYLFVYVMTLEFGSQGLEVMSEMSVQLTGIIFSTIIFRVSRQRHDDSFYSSSKISTIQWRAKQPSKSTVIPGPGVGSSTATMPFPSTIDISETVYRDEIELPSGDFHDDSYASHGKASGKVDPAHSLKFAAV